ncbi:citramalate synthase, partial [Oscillospiraceae bacterium OttesenSCG-928-G22]|nr:citramalate synthase [Oscillospiraceae bacterium OttesenSCG-928-G22]
MDVALYDTTLREGAQGASTDFTLADRERIFALLCDMEVPYIEAGNPASNPADAEFFRRVTSPKRAKLAAFGATCRVGADPAADTGLAALLLAGTPVITIFGKSWDYHVDEVLRTSRGENLRMIEETVRYLTSHGREVHFDAEHFFDGYRANRDYALEVLRAAVRGGATWLCLCDTNGGTFPDAVERTVFDVLRDISLPVAIHAHNDTGMAEANAVAAVSAGVKMVQCTLAGAGERCGNTNLFTAAPNLQLKMGLSCLPEGVMSRLAS